MHPWAIRIKDSNHLNINAMLAVVIEEQCFGGTLPFVVARPDSNATNISTIFFRLRMKLRCGVTVDLEEHKEGYLARSG